MQRPSEAMVGDGTRATLAKAEKALAGCLSPSAPPTDRAKRGKLAGSTGLEPAASAVTGQRSSQLNYDPKEMASVMSDREFRIAD